MFGNQYARVWSRRSERTVYIIGSGDDDSVAFWILAVAFWRLVNDASQYDLSIYNSLPNNRLRI
jgi:hypothetical protein